MIVTWLSDTLAFELQNTNLSEQALKAAEKKVDKYKKKK